MSYDCVIATKDRIAALRMSIPLILGQSIRPERLVIVDISADHDAVRTEINDICKNNSFDNIFVIQADAANSARQRNIGLEFVEAPIVLFPDDDSMWFPGFAESVLRVYDADRRGQVGGVTGVSVPALPAELGQPTYRRNRLAFANMAVQPARNFFEGRVVPKPSDLIARTTWTADIDVVDNVKSKRVTTIAGFRMSFRTDVVKNVRFDETLGYGVGYSTLEDMDLSLGILRKGYALVSAEDAKVCHLVFPGKRAKGYNYGFSWIANCTYTCRKNIATDTYLYGSLERFLLYKLSLYATRLHTEYGRDVFSGAFDAWRNRDKLIKSDDAGLADAYKALCDRYIKR